MNIKPRRICGAFLLHYPEENETGNIISKPMREYNAKSLLLFIFAA